MLTWAKTLSAQDTPSSYALDKVCKQIMKMLGDPTEKLTVPSGNTFYLNSIGKAIAMVGGQGRFTTEVSNLTTPFRTFLTHLPVSRCKIILRMDVAACLRSIMEGKC